ncbi:MAG: D-TA family PLP-dependent enzyme [Planctomycetes bacterium]|nr:D-TA family PLP-dependent enzyme [Planctomycetota bacterium]
MNHAAASPDPSSLPTPALVLDAGRVGRNVARLADYAAGHGIAVRPHAKTHKSVAIARLQLAAGAVGLTVAKVGEAEALLPAFDDRPPDLLVAYPTVDEPRTRRLALLARSGTVRVAVDTPFAIEAIGAAARAAGVTVGVLADLDVGMGRTGVATADDLVALAAAASATAGLRLDGIFCYPGHVWARPAEQAAPLAAVAATLAAAVDRFDRHGLCREIVSGGSTPTAFQSHLVPQVTEIRPGTFVCNDMNTVRGGFCSLDDCAAGIVCTVVSDAVAGQVVLDGGTKTLTSDPCGPAPDSGHGQIVEYPDAVVVKLTEEHGQVDVSRCPRRPRVGERVTVIPNHVCPCVNLQDTVWWREGDGTVRPLPVDARGRLS